jgi:hypothetical protein
MVCRGDVPSQRLSAACKEAGRVFIAGWKTKKLTGQRYSKQFSDLSRNPGTSAAATTPA